MKARRDAPLTVVGFLLSLLAVLLCLAVAAPAPVSAELQGKKKKSEKRQEDDEDRQDRELGEEGGEEGSGGARQLLVPAVIVQKDPNGWWEIVVKGTAMVPDKLELQISLHFANHTNDAKEIKTHIPIQGGAFGLEEPIIFGRMDPKITPSGWYWVVVRFRYDDQADPEALEAFRQMFPKPDEWQRYVDFSEQKAARLGTESQEAREDRERRAHYKESTKMAREILDEYDEALVCALRVCFENPQEWKDYVREKSLLREEGEDLKKLLDELKEKDRFRKKGKLDAGEWRDFIDREPSREIATHPLKTGGLRGRILRLMSDHQEFKKSMLAGKLPKADERLDKMISSLYGVTMRWSRVLYKRAGLKKDPKDERPIDPIPLIGQGTHREVFNLAATVDQEVAVHLPEK